MKTKNSFSKLRLFAIIFMIVAVIGIFMGMARQDSVLVGVGFMGLVGSVIIRILRFLYRD